MFIAFLFILAVIHSAQCNRIGHEGKTALAVKQGIQNYINSIPIGITDFKELVLRSEIFIDNTLFCKEILASSLHRWTIASPDQWGRSTLLTMLKAFLEIEVDENGSSIPKESSYSYNLFKKAQVKHKDGRTEPLTTPLLLADEKEIINNYLGKYPVIYVTFKDVVGENRTDIQLQAAIAIQRAFKQHEYMLTVMERNIQNSSTKDGSFYTDDDLETFAEYLHVTETSLVALDEVLVRLYFLANMLEKHFGKKCFLLMDDYDTPIHNALKFRVYQRRDEQDIFHSFDTATSYKLTSIHFEKVIEMGTFIIRPMFIDNDKFQVEDTLFEENNDNETRCSPMREYFAFKQAHVKFLLEKYNMTEQFDKAKTWYDGYESSVSTEPFYNPESIVRFLHHKRFANYGALRSKFSEYIQNELKKDSGLKDSLVSLIGGDTKNDFANKLYSANDKFSFEGTTNSNWELFYHLLRIELRITVNRRKPPTNALPNYESTLLISKWLINYYVQKYQINEALLNDTAIALRDFILSEGANKSFTKCWQHLYNSTFQQANETESTPNLQDQSTILHCVALQMKCTSHFQIDVFCEDQVARRFLIYFRDMKVGVVILIERSNISFSKSIGSPYAMAQTRNVTELKNIFSEVEMTLLVML